MARTYSEELLARAQAYLASPERERRLTEASREELLALHNLITGEQRSWCPACQYSDFYHVVSAYVREATHFFHPETVSDTQYTFAPAFRNESISDERYAKKVTADNLTDEDAAFLIPRGYGHVIIALAAASMVAAEPVGAAPATEVVPEKLLVPQADLDAEQAAHAATKQALTGEKQQYETLLSKYNDANGSRVKTENALKSEKAAHGETKKQLAEVQKQLTEALAKIAEPTIVPPAANTDAPADAATV